MKVSLQTLLAGVLLVFGLSYGVTVSEIRSLPPAVPHRIAPNKLTANQAIAALQAEDDHYWLSARDKVGKNVIDLIAQNETELDRNMRFCKLAHGKRGKKEIALTFDDGPHPLYTPQILDILKRYDVKATFFLVGEMAERYPGLVRAEAAAGHNIGNHTYHHVSLIKIPQSDTATEIKTCGEVLKHITGASPHLFRPPGGDYNQDVAEASEALGYNLILWTDDPGDYASPGENTILSRTLDKATDGGIILIHDGIQQTIDILPQMIESLQKQGYTFVTIDQMLAERRGIRTAPEESAAVNGQDIHPDGA